jgi:hypothetical protein
MVAMSTAAVMLVFAWPALANGPALRVIKLQRDGTTGSFTTNELTLTETNGDYVAHTIEYEIQVTNTGNVPLTLSLNDSLCDADTIEGPFPIRGSLSGNVLGPGGQAQYTCSHRLLQSDPTTFTNVATVTGTPPSGPAVRGTSSVTVTRRALGSTKVCRTPTGRVVQYHGHRKPAACTAHRRPSRRPRRPRGSTG